MKKLHCLYVSKLKEHMKIEIYVRTLRFLSFVGSTKREVASRGTPWELGRVCVCRLVNTLFWVFFQC
jgi:hypothetical protein